MKRPNTYRNLGIALLLVLAVVAQQWLESRETGTGSAPTGETSSRAEQVGSAEIDRAFAAQRSNVWLSGDGRVQRVLSDDNDGSRHQRFIVRLASDRTVLIAHNIDLAPRVENLSEGDPVSFRGEYEWNPQGGVVHWTHHDPRGSREGGWIRHHGETYR